MIILASPFQYPTPSDMEAPQRISTRSHHSMQNKNSKNLCLRIGDSPTKNKLIMVDPKPNESNDTFAVPLRHQLTKRVSEAQIYTLPPQLKSARSTPSTPRLPSGSSGFDSTASPSSSTSSSPFNKPTLPTINTKFHNRPRATTIATSVPQIQTPSNDSMESTTRYWVLQENTPMSSTNYDNDMKSIPYNTHSDEDSPSYSESYREKYYPSGPLLVVPPFIYLYSEPSLKEVMDYDVIINVAKEITNYKEQLPLSKQGCYYHFTWSHTSQITKNLPQLTELIQNAYASKKKVLIHCQCGVSRSASLIVAYMMRYDKLSLNEAYNKLKSVAREISPNMSLLFQLMEWEDWLNNCDSINDNCRKQSFESISEFGELSL